MLYTYTQLVVGCGVSAIAGMVFTLIVTAVFPFEEPGPKRGKKR